MGKKDKNKKKGLGAEKTALKTQKKAKSKLKKLTGEDAIENVVKALEEGERKRRTVEEVPVEGGKPSSRANFSIVAHPDNPEIVIFGGEFFNGQKTTIFNELLVYNTKRKSWTMLQSPGAPPPRSSHQAVISSQGGGQLWIFGGEFASQSESQFYHYRDLWVYHFTTKKWEKVVTEERNGPTPRSGHRMVLLKKHLVIFGGFHDILAGETKYYNDVHVFDTTDRIWKKLEISGTPPCPRSACCMYPLSDGRIVVYGGYCKEKVKGPKSKKSAEKGKILTDLFTLVPEKNDDSLTKWKWQSIKQSGHKPTPPRSGLCCASVPNSNKGFFFGGVQDLEDDDDEDDEEATGQFFNDLFSLQVDNDKGSWQKVEYSSKSSNDKRRRRALKEDDKEASEEEEEVDETHLQKISISSKESSKTVTVEEGIFTVTSTVVSEPKASTSLALALPPVTTEGETSPVLVPLPRYSSGMAIKQGFLFLYGGIFEDKDERQITFNDFYCIDFKKLDEWQVLIEPDLHAVEWIESDSSSSGSESDLDVDSDSDSDGDMDTD